MHLRQYELDTLIAFEGFSLDPDAVMNLYLRGVTQTNTSRAVNKRSAVVRLYQRAHTGWRKVATVAAAALAIGLGYHVVFGQNGLTVYEQKRQDEHALDTQLNSLQRENELLRSHVDRLQSDPNAIEHQAREELHYTRPGEVIYTLPSSPSEKTADQSKR